MYQTYVARLVGIFPRKYDVRLLDGVPYIGAHSDESAMCYGLVKKGNGPPHVNLVTPCCDMDQLLNVTLSTTTRNEHTGNLDSAQSTLQLGRNLFVANFRRGDCPLKLLDLDPQWEVSEIPLVGACYWFGAYGGMVPKQDVVSYLSNFATIAELARAQGEEEACTWHRVLKSAAHVVWESGGALRTRTDVFSQSVLKKHGIHLPCDVLDVIEAELWHCLETEN